MIWASMTAWHPLRVILQSHISTVSLRRWGTMDLTWLVTNCGHLRMGGSTAWQSLCRNWEVLRKQLQAPRPVNVVEWRALPLWRNHVNQRQSISRKLSAKQTLIRETGFNTMGNMHEIQDGKLSL